MFNKTINGYTIKRPLGEGGMAEVWYAENKIGKPAAIKILNPALAMIAPIVERFVNEGKIMVKLYHPNIRQVYDYDEVEGRPCIIMEYLEGDDLKQRMLNGEQLSDERMQKWWNQLVDALSYTHQQGVIHRDIKPSNIFIDKLDNVRLMDFGIAKIDEYGGHTQTGVAMGTRIYMSPEQVRDPKRVKAATDAYSLAVTFVHLLTGKAPYDTTTSSDFDIQLSIVSQPLDLSGLPNDWQDFLMPYLEKDAGKRPDLKHFANQSSVQDSHSQDKNDTPPSFISSTEETLIETDSVNKTSQTNITKAQNDLIFQVKGVSFTMKFVEGGTFQMGSLNGFNDEKPVHSVTLSDFCIGETEVTQALWKAVMNNNPSHFVGDLLPVENVSWDACQEFIQNLNSITGKSFRLPTEAEWEYAARGGKKSKGHDFAGGLFLPKLAWQRDNSGGSTHAVKTKLPNELALYDMSGNVWEWCEDWYGDYIEQAQRDPIGPSSGLSRVLRGGSWLNPPKSCRVSKRGSYYPKSHDHNFGFRLALSPDNAK